MKDIIGYYLIFLLVLILGCLPAHRGRMATPAVTDGQPPQLEFSDELDKRIRFLNTRLEVEELADDDKKIALNLLNTYQELQRLSSSQPTEALYLSVIHDLFKSLSAMDERYFSETKDTAGDLSETISLFAKKREEILDSYISGDFQAVIDLCIELKTMFGHDSLTPDIGLLFALSLAKKGMMDEAINIGEGIANELETSPDIVQLRVGIAEWYLQQGQREKAILVYEKLADTLDEIGIDVHLLNRKITAAESAGKETGLIPGQEPSQDTEKMTVDDLLEKVERLLEENRFSEARDLLLMKEQNVHSASEVEVINQALKRLELAEEDYLEEKISVISMKRDMEQARRLLEEEKFEEVISRLESMEQSEEDNREIKGLKQFATEKLINRERNRAAKFFLTAKETQNPDRKEEYLRKALQILKALVEKYPLSNLNQRLTSHIKIVEEELAKLEQ